MRNNSNFLKAILLLFIYSCDMVEDPSIMGEWRSHEVMHITTMYNYEFGKTKGSKKEVKGVSGKESLTAFSLHPFNTNSPLFPSNEEKYYAIKDNVIFFFKLQGNERYLQYNLYGVLNEETKISIYSGNPDNGIDNGIDQEVLYKK